MNFKIKENHKKQIMLVLLIIVAINILSILLTLAFNNNILRTVILYIISLIYIGFVVYALKKENNENNINKNTNFENKYDPILTRFILKNEFELDEQLLNSEIKYLLKKQYIIIDKEKNTIKLKDRNQFKQIDALERINLEKIKEYSTEEIPSYESMFIGKILFAFNSEISIDEFRRNIQTNYYYQRGEICKLAMEKMLLYETEKRGMLKQGNNINYMFITGVFNILTSVILFAVMARLNIIFLIATIINVTYNVLIIKNENVLAYNYSDDIINYKNKLLEYIEALKKGNITQLNNTYIENTEENIEETTNNIDNNEELKFLFGINHTEDLFIH